MIYDVYSVNVLAPSGHILLHGTRDPETKLWLFDISSAVSSLPFSINNVLHFPRHADRAMFYNRCFGSCANSTMISALRNGFFKLPYLLLERYLLKDLPNRTAQAYRHLDHTRKGQRSTKRPDRRKSVSTPIDTLLVIPDFLAADDVPAIFVKDFSAARMHVDATGRFLVVSVNSYSYDLIFYVEGFNYIQVELLRNRTAVSYTKAYRKAFQFFTLHNIPCRIVRLDN